MDSSMGTSGSRVTWICPWKMPHADVSGSRDKWICPWKVLLTDTFGGQSYEELPFDDTPDGYFWI